MNKTTISTFGKLTAANILFSHAIIFSTTQEAGIGNWNRKMKWTDVLVMSNFLSLMNKMLWTDFVERRVKETIKYGEKFGWDFLRHHRKK